MNVYNLFQSLSSLQQHLDHFVLVRNFDLDTKAKRQSDRGAIRFRSRCELGFNYIFQFSQLSATKGAHRLSLALENNSSFVGSPDFPFTMGKNELIN